MKKKYQVVWPNIAENDLNNIIEYIDRPSDNNIKKHEETWKIICDECNIRYFND